jgi:hypothetical protein
MPVAGGLCLLCIPCGDCLLTHDALLLLLQAHSASARELRRIALEALEALFGLQLPLPAATVRQYMQGIAGMMTR